MALKSIIDKAKYDSLSDELKKEYKADGDDYVLDITELDKHPQAGALKRAKDRVSEERDTIKNEFADFKKAQESTRKQYEADLKALRDGKGNSEEDIAKVRADYEKKLAKTRTEYEQKIDGLNGDLKNVMVTDKAAALATEWSKAPSLMKGQIASRLTTERNDKGALELRVLDKEGNPSAMSISDLKAEFYADKEYAPVLKANGASGSPSRGEQQSGSAQHQSGKSSGREPITELSQVKNASDMAAYRAYQREAAGEEA